MSLVTPRILPEHLREFLNVNAGPSARGPSAVRILGKVTSLRGEAATITCGSHGDVTLVLNRDSHLQMDKMVDVVGKVVEVDGVSLLFPSGSSSSSSSSSFGVYVLGNKRTNRRLVMYRVLQSVCSVPLIAETRLISVCV